MCIQKAGLLSVERVLVLFFLPFFLLGVRQKLSFRWRVRARRTRRPPGRNYTGSTRSREQRKALFIYIYNITALETMPALFINRLVRGKRAVAQQ